MSNKSIREYNEMKNLFSDPKFVRQAWKALGTAIAMRPAAHPIASYDKEGTETLNYKIESYSYNKLAQDIKNIGKENREPTEIEMILHCQMIKARTDTSAALFIRDTLGAKPVDESKTDLQVNNPYESLSDEELELLAKHREIKQLEQQKSQLENKHE